MKNIQILLTLLILLLLVIPLGAQPVFTVSSSYNNLLSNPERQGLLDLLLKEVFNRLDREVRIVYTETARSLVDVNAGVYNAEINRIEGMETAYPNLVRVPEPNMIMDFTAFAKTDLPVSRWSDLEPYCVGLVKGWKILEEHTRELPRVNAVPTEIQLFRMLDADRIDVALYARRTGYAVVDSLGLSGIKHIDPPLESQPMYLYLHKSQASLAGPIAETLRQMKRDGSYAVIMGED
jgi:polar amino acid transport system substrate-binding protein